MFNDPTGLAASDTTKKGGQSTLPTPSSDDKVYNSNQPTTQVEGIQVDKAANDAANANPVEAKSEVQTSNGGYTWDERDWAVYDWVMQNARNSPFGRTLMFNKDRIGILSNKNFQQIYGRHANFMAGAMFFGLAFENGAGGFRTSLASSRGFGLTPRYKGLIDAKITTPQPQESGPLSYSMENGIVKVGGMPLSKRVDFIINTNGELVIGGGHWKMSGEAIFVRAAGRLKFKDGQVVSIMNQSGHYQPSIVQGERFPGLLRNIGLNLKGTRLALYKWTNGKPRVISNTTLNY